MPSVFVLDGPRLAGFRDIYMSPARGVNARETSTGPTQVPQAPIRPGIRPGPLAGLGGAVRAGLGEISDGAKTSMIALGMLAVVGVVFYRGYARRRRRRRR